MGTPGRANPFPGLRPFMQEEADLFFGRDKQSDELVRRLASRRFLAIVGTSGSGKSSLVRAGLLPSLEGGLMAKAGAHWRMAILRPQDDPIGFLARAIVETGMLSHLDLAQPAAEGVVETTLRRSSLGLVEAARLARLEPHENLLILVDQFEELFRFADLARQRGGGDEAPAFIKLLLEAARHAEAPVYVVITMRSDFLGDCARFRDLPEAISDCQYLIPRLTRDELQAVITGPTGVRGGRVAPSLVQHLLNDIGDDMDQLPVLQHALMRAWDRWERSDPDGRPVELTDLEAIGGMAEALSQHADEAFASLASERDRKIAERLFKCLTERGPDNREIRRPTQLSRIAAIVNADPAEVVRVIDVFRAPGRSFLIPPHDIALEPESVIDISHESLIRQWGRLRNWVEEEAQSAQMYRRLAETATLHAAGKSGLWRDPDLQLALNWRRETGPDEHWGERYRPGFQEAMRFLNESAVAREAERRAAWWRTVVLPLALLLVLVVVLGAWAINSAQKRQAAAILDVEIKARKEAEEARDEARRAEKIERQRTQELLAQFGWNEEKLTMAASDKHAVSQSLYANQALQQALPRAGRDRRKNITVEYFPKNVDENKVEAALSELGFTLRKPAAIVQRIPTNAIWFGSPVDVEDVKLVALTLIRAGVQIRAIKPIQEYLVNKKDLPLIQVGADSSIVNDPPLTVEAIRGAERFTR